MAKSKAKSVVLVNPSKRVGDLSLGFEHAERLLKMPQNGGWMLPKDSLYKLTADGLIKKSSNRAAKEPQK